jgi:GNAT superfamily N-acetyltransferase
VRYDKFAGSSFLCSQGNRLNAMDSSSTSRPREPCETLQAESGLQPTDATMITVRRASSQGDREKIFRLRYEIYVEEMRRRQTHADHALRFIEEPFDDASAVLLLAEQDGEAVGTVRINFARHGPLEEADSYDLTRFAPFYPEHLSMTTKLMVRPEHRSGNATRLLVAEAYSAMRRAGILVDVIDCNPHLVQFFQRIGYRLYKQNIAHPDYGTVIPMALLVGDLEYMRRVRSPLLALAEGFGPTPQTVGFFDRAFPDFADSLPLFAIEPSLLWRHLGEEIGRPPEEALSFLRGLTRKQVEELLQHQSLLGYRAGETVIAAGDEANSVFCILKGELELLVDRPGRSLIVGILHRGDVFGELGSVTGSPHRVTVRARQDTRVLVLSRSGLRKLAAAAPKLTIDLLTNLRHLLAERFNSPQEGDL